MRSAQSLIALPDPEVDRIGEVQRLAGFDHQLRMALTELRQLPPGLVEPAGEGVEPSAGQHGEQVFVAIGSQHLEVVGTQDGQVAPVLVQSETQLIAQVLRVHGRDACLIAPADQHQSACPPDRAGGRCARGVGAVRAPRWSQRPAHRAALPEVRAWRGSGCRCHRPPPAGQAGAACCQSVTARDSASASGSRRWVRSGSSAISVGPAREPLRWMQQTPPGPRRAGG